MNTKENKKTMQRRPATLPAGATPAAPAADEAAPGGRVYTPAAPALLTPEQCAAAFGVCKSTVREWRRQGCPVVYIGRSMAGAGSRPRYDVAAVRSWLERKLHP